MATYEKIKLSADSTGSGVWLDFSASAINVHTTSTSSTVLDEVWLYFSNNGLSSATCSMEIGGTNTIRFTVPSYSGMFLALPGILMSGTGTAGTVLTATNDSSSGGVTVYGYVNRITP
jgi:hypothetical protein